ncbi:hypothetical protein [Microbacterium sp. GXF6406]
MSDPTATEPTDALWSRLRLIESQPIAQRADAYATVHDELFRRLESSSSMSGSTAGPQ